MSKDYSYNGYFSWNGLRFDINATSFSYSWKLVQSGASQARQAYIFYPKRVEQSVLTVELIFRNPKEYRLFGDFVREYHQGVTSGNGLTNMYFVLKDSTILTGDAGDPTGVVYQVAIPNVSLNFNITLVAPKIHLDLTILKDMLDTSDETGSDTNGSFDNLTQKVTAKDIADANKADTAYTGVNKYRRTFA